jgi:hypothetical protein
MAQGFAQVPATGPEELLVAELEVDPLLEVLPVVLLLPLLLVVGLPVDDDDVAPPEPLPDP